jgi:sulfide dehydrogenase cytochrome subunit
MLLPLLSLLLIGSRVAAAEQPPAAPPLAVQACFPCHGPAGNSQGPATPSLAGLPRVYLLKVLRAYRHGGRFGTVMGRLLQHASDAQLSVMADYFSRQRPQIPKQRFSWEQAAKGRQLHRIYCRSCHGDSGQAPEIGTPRLNGVWMDYLRWTLRDYLVGVNHADEEMSQALIWVIRRHGEAGLEALVHYYGSARPDRAEPP